MSPDTAPATVPTSDQAEKLRAIAARQGTLGKSTYENLLGSGAQLWKSDEEFGQFLEHIRAIRQAKRSPARVLGCPG